MLSYKACDPAVTNQSTASSQQMTGRPGILAGSKNNAVLSIGAAG